MIRRIAQPYSLITILVLFVLMVQARLWAPYWDTHNVVAILTWDAMGYYLYLPAKFIYNDLSYLRFIPDIMREYSPTGSFYQAFQVPGGPEGAMVMKYPVGLAILQTPFFFLGHWAAGWLHYPQDGFSAPYQVAIAFGGMVYGLLGLGILRRVLLRFYSDVITAVTLALLVLGTNYLQYAVFDAAMPHTYDFTLYALLIWATIHWHERPRRWVAAAIGLLLGLLILTRPSEAVAVLIPLLWGVSSKQTAREKLQLVLRRWPDVLLLGLFLFLGVLPQLLYWKWATGSFIVYSYQEQTFSFLKPHTWPVLFSFRKGWLIYTPLMLLTIVGIGLLWRRHRSIALSVTAYFIINLWVVSAWDVWWYGGSIGQRALVQSYAALSLGLAALLAWAAEPQRRTVAAWLLAPLIVLLVDLNLFQHWQYMYGYIHAEEMTKRYYWAIFNKTKPTQEDFALLDVKTRIRQVTKNYERRTLGNLDFENQPVSDSTGITNERGFESGQAFRTTPQRQYGPALSLKLSDAGLQPGQWVRASCQVYSDWGAWGSKLVMSIERAGKAVQWNAVKLQNPLSVSKAWNEVYFDVPLAPEVEPGDELRIYVLNEGGSPALIDNIRAELLTPTDDVAAH
ncbi:hypothetical protein [Hymenobacter sp. CRA2]|uniref:hypothetical protein n=1 Tax=Hymenobacter sp. CRA2 TaxID=1955620 RepID=UPI00098ECB52|nr:hypothetical protein [Hymenobacter sp. CRA2]OON70801.1 hypothetical protein B0919_01965 [Hymenobacter sp. CRA2]